MINYQNYEEMLEKEGYVISGFLGASMYPTFHRNDLLTIVKQDSYSLYDAVLYKTNNKYLVHRIVDIKDNHFIIRGDNTVLDERVENIQLLGKVKSLIRKGKQIDLDENKNKQDYLKSLKTLKLRKTIHKLKSLICG